MNEGFMSQTDRWKINSDWSDPLAILKFDKLKEEQE